MSDPLDAKALFDSDSESETGSPRHTSLNETQVVNSSKHASDELFESSSSPSSASPSSPPSSSRSASPLHSSQTPAKKSSQNQSKSRREIEMEEDDAIETALKQSIPLTDVPISVPSCYVDESTNSVSDGQSMFFRAVFPPSVGIDTKPFRPELFQSEDSTFRDARNRNVHYEDLVRYKISADKKTESNARIVEWENGDYSLMIGSTLYRVMMPRADFEYVYEGSEPYTLLVCKGPIAKRMQIAQASITSSSLGAGFGDRKRSRLGASVPTGDGANSSSTGHVRGVLETALGAIKPHEEVKISLGVKRSRKVEGPLQDSYYDENGWEDEEEGDAGENEEDAGYEEDEDDEDGMRSKKKKRSGVAFVRVVDDSDGEEEDKGAKKNELDADFLEGNADGKQKKKRVVDDDE
eukprot:ANDGO_06146.mRNA.1 Protein LEO1 homolog